MKERMNVTVPEEVLRKARELAVQEDRSLSAMITVLIKEGIKQKEKAA